MSEKSLELIVKYEAIDFVPIIGLTRYPLRLVMNTAKVRPKMMENLSTFYSTMGSILFHGVPRLTLLSMYNVAFLYGLLECLDKHIP